MKILVPDHTKKLTKQNVFDIVWERAKIKKQAIAKIAGLTTNRCVYRTKNRDNCCFIGALIPDSKYKPEMDNTLGLWAVLYDLHKTFTFNTKDNHIFFAYFVKWNRFITYELHNSPYIINNF